jgi:hypothetical protein
MSRHGFGDVSGVDKLAPIKTDCSRDNVARILGVDSDGSFIAPVQRRIADLDRILMWRMNVIMVKLATDLRPRVRDRCAKACKFLCLVNT